MVNNFEMVFVDTDSITFCKPGGEGFSKEEQENLRTSLNTLYPERISWEPNFYAEKVIVLKTKNYVVWAGGKLKVKGSAIKASTKEPALKQFIKDIIQSMLEDRGDYAEIYHRYAREIAEIRDMSRWVTRKTITDKVLTNIRTNEKKVREAIAGTEYVEGDRIYLYFRPDKSLRLLEHFDGDYCRKSLLRKLWTTAQVFANVIDVKIFFPNLALKKNGGLLDELCA